MASVSEGTGRDEGFIGRGGYSDYLSSYLFSAIACARQFISPPFMYDTRRFATFVSIHISKGNVTRLRLKCLVDFTSV